MKYEIEDKIIDQADKLRNYIWGRYLTRAYNVESALGKTGSKMLADLIELTQELDIQRNGKEPPKESNDDS